MPEQWTRATCPCGARNYVYLGVSDDQSGPDVEAYTCHACGKKNHVPGYAEWVRDSDGDWQDAEECFGYPGKPA